MEITETTALIRLGVSLLLGGAIGLERQLNRHPAGMRTFMLICVGCTMATLASIYIGQANLGVKGADSSRIAAQAISAIGFIGAGLIMKSSEGVTGLTTAATCFVTAAIGIAVGVGMIWTASALTVAIVLILLSTAILSKFQDKNKK